MRHEIDSQTSAPANPLGRMFRIAASVTALAGLMLASSNPVMAADKPPAPKGPVIVGDVDLSAPHVSSDKSMQVKSASPCSNLLSGFAPLGFGWSGEFRWLACSYWGTTSTATKNYQWYVSSNSSSLACAQGYGFRADHSPTWVYLSCGDSGATQVSWGEVAAYPKMKFKSLSGLIVPLYWY